MIDKDFGYTIYVCDDHFDDAAVSASEDVCPYCEIKRLSAEGERKDAVVEAANVVLFNYAESNPIPRGRHQDD